MHWIFYRAVHEGVKEGVKCGQQYTAEGVFHVLPHPILIFFSMVLQPHWMALADGKTFFHRPPASYLRLMEFSNGINFYEGQLKTFSNR